MEVVVCVTGEKGVVFLRELLQRNGCIARVFSYRQSDDASRAFERIAEICSQNALPLIEKKRPDKADFANADMILFVGWQYLLPFLDDRIIVFHDSLLPKYRGFAPTVAALLAGDSRIGVTAFRPNDRVDAGPIVAQAHADLAPPVRIGEAFAQQGALMATLAKELLDLVACGTPIPAIPQVEGNATYAIWRDAEDYWIDWSKPADAIVRLIHAVGPPYGGALTSIDGNTLVVDEGHVVDDLAFSDRHHGKVWELNHFGPLIICGEGMLQITKIRYAGTESPFVFNRTRSRFKTMV